MDQIYPLPSSQDRILSSITFLSRLYCILHITYFTRIMTMLSCADPGLKVAFKCLNV